MGRNRPLQPGSVSKQRGFSLAEALISMAMLAMIMGAAASLFLNYSRITKQSSPKERNLVGGQLALERMRSEVAEALVLREPAVNRPSARLFFDKLDPSRDRLPVPLDPTQAFSPQAPTCQVEYSLVSGQLLRRTRGSGFQSEELLMDKVVGLATEFVAPAGVNIRLTLQEEKAQNLCGTFATVWIRP